MKLRYFGLFVAVAAGIWACGDDEPDALSSLPARADLGDDEDEGGDAAAFPPPNDDPNIGGVDDDAGPPPPPPDAGLDAGAQHIPSPVPGKSVTYPFGVKNSRYAAGYHTGDDYATPTGSSAVAVRNGKIAWSNDNGGAYGKWMGLEADNGRTYVYCHLSSRLLSAGAVVKAGQVIAKTGATGNVTGPHLHFEDHPKGPFVYAQVRKPAW